MKPKISIITLGIKDINISLKFYSDLGFKAYNYKETDGYVMFEMEGTWLALFPKEKLSQDATVSNGVSANFTLAHNVRSEKEVDEVFNFALSIGAKEVKKPAKSNWGGYSGYFSDPDGYLWEIAFNPFTDLT